MTLLENLFADGILREFYSLEGNVNLLDSEENYVIEVAVPGLSKEDIKVSMDPGRITINGKKAEKDKGNYLRHTFQRSRDVHEVIKVPEWISTDQGVTAKVQDGILEITIPKTGPRSIEIL